MAGGFHYPAARYLRWYLLAPAITQQQGDSEYTDYCTEYDVLLDENAPSGSQ